MPTRILIFHPEAPSVSSSGFSYPSVSAGVKYTPFPHRIAPKLISKRIKWSWPIIMQVMRFANIFNPGYYGIWVHFFQTGTVATHTGSHLTRVSGQTAEVEKHQGKQDHLGERKAARSPRLQSPTVPTPSQFTGCVNAEWLHLFVNQFPQLEMEILTGLILRGSVMIKR